MSKLSKAEIHAIRRWVRQRDCITVLDLLKLWRATFRAARAEMRKRRFFRELHTDCWTRRTGRQGAATR